MPPGCFADWDLTTDILLVQAKAFLAELRKAESALFYSQSNTERTCGGHQFTACPACKSFELPRLAHFCSLRPNYPSSQRLRETAQAALQPFQQWGLLSFQTSGSTWKAITARLTKDCLLSHTQNLEILTRGVSDNQTPEGRFWKITAALAWSAILSFLQRSAKIIMFFCCRKWFEPDTSNFAHYPRGFCQELQCVEHMERLEKSTDAMEIEKALARATCSAGVNSPEADRAESAVALVMLLRARLSVDRWLGMLQYLTGAICKWWRRRRRRRWWWWWLCFPCFVPGVRTCRNLVKWSAVRWCSHIPLRQKGWSCPRRP